MDPGELLRRQHDDIERRMMDLESAEPHQRRAMLAELARALFRHEALEERLFYPAVRRRETDAFLTASLDEHAEMRALLHELARLPPDALEFGPLLAHLRAAFDAHIVEEHTELFPQAERLLGREKWAALGASLAAEAESLRADEPPGASPQTSAEPR